MESNRVKKLWGQDFRIVPDGLNVTDVALFVEGLMSRYQSSIDKASHIEPLHELARKTVEEAEHIAGEIKRRSEEEAESLATQIRSDAEHSADEIVQRAFAAGTAIEEEAQRKAREKVDELQITFSTMKRWASDEFAALKDVEERMGVFLSAYESFLSLLDRGVARPPNGAEQSDFSATIPQEWQPNSGGADDAR
jgi:cell division septum initiation protein DivIVA